MLLSALSHPNKSHRKSVLLPNESNKLAELIGIVFGDGGIGNTWQVVISLNSEKDKDYAQYVTNLFEELFGIKIAQRKRPNQNTLILVVSSTTIVDFLVSKGAVRGNKILQEINIPDWISNNIEYAKAFVRGLIDTGGCLFIHKHTVKGKKFENIGFCFTSFSKRLIVSIDSILKYFKIHSHITDHDRRIYLYREADVVKYLSVFGSSNPRIYNKYYEWRDARAV